MLRFIEAAPGIDSTVLLAEDGPLVAGLEAAGARVEVIPLSERTRGLKRTEVRAGGAQAQAALDIARYIETLRRRLRQLQPDVISTISLKAGAYGVLAGRLGRIPVVWHLHDQIDASYLARQAVPPMRALIGTMPSAIISPSQTTLATVGRFRPGILRTVIPHPIPMPPTPVTIRDEVRRIGIVGRIAPWKGQDVLLKAFAEAIPDPDIHAVVVGSAIFGEADYGRQLEQLAVDLGIGDRAEFTGFRSDVQREFEQLDLLVHASILTEPFGTVVFEAMAAGLPVIGARSGGVAEYIVDGRHGLLHTPGDVDELGRLLRRAVDDAELRRTLAQNGRALTETMAPEKIAGRWIEVYESVLGRTPRTASYARA